MISEHSPGKSGKAAEAGVASAGRVISPMDLDEIILGAVNIFIGPPVDIRAVVKLFNSLNGINDIKIHYCSGALGKTLLLSVILEKPMPLASVIMQIPGIKVSEWVADAVFQPKEPAVSLFADKNSNVPRMNITVESIG